MRVGSSAAPTLTGAAIGAASAGIAGGAPSEACTGIRTVSVRTREGAAATAAALSGHGGSIAGDEPLAGSTGAAIAGDEPVDGAAMPGDEPVDGAGMPG